MHGTYTLNGTASAVTSFSIDCALKTGTYKLVGCPENGSLESYSLICKKDSTSGSELARDSGNGSEIDIKETTSVVIYMRINKGYPCSNLVFKPMVTKNLQVKYADYVQYTGSSGMLNNDVSKIVNQLNDHTVLSDVPASAKFTDTITGVQNNLVSTLTNEALSAYQGKVLNDKITDLSNSKVDSSSGLNGAAVPESGVWFAVYTGGGSSGPISGMIIGNGSTVYYKSDSSMTARVSDNILQLSKSGFSMSAKTFY